MSYDVYTANPLLPVDPGYMGVSPCDISYFDNVMTEDGLYQVPDNTNILTLSSCSSSEIRTEYMSFESM